MAKKRYKYANGRKTASNNEELINHYRTMVHDLNKFNNHNNRRPNRNYSANNNDVYDNFKYFTPNNNRYYKNHSNTYINKKRRRGYKLTGQNEDEESFSTHSISEENEEDESEGEEESEKFTSDNKSQSEDYLDENEKVFDNNSVSSETNSSSNINKDNNNLINKSSPWISEHTTTLSGMLRLHSEILDFYKFMSPTEKEAETINSIFETIKSIINKKFPKYKVKLFGSNTTKLNLPNSDMDIVVVPDNTLSAYHDQLKVFIQIKTLLLIQGTFREIKLINAKVPIIKTKYLNIDIDISLGRKNGYAATKVINTILEQFPSIRPILFVLKYYMRQKGLNVTYTGGISSFCLFSLVYAYILYLKKNNQLSPQNGKEEGQMTLGHLLIGLFDFYGFRFNYDKVGISVRYGGFFYKKADRLFLDNSSSVKGGGILSLENFQNINQDIGGNCFRFSEVVEAFKVAYWNLGDFNKIESEYENEGNNFSYLGRFIKRDKLIKKRATIKNS